MEFLLCLGINILKKEDKFLTPTYRGGNFSYAVEAQFYMAKI